MSNIYNATVDLEAEEKVRNLIGSVVAATLKLKNYGYSDETAYEVVPLIVGKEIKGNPEMIERLMDILEGIYALDSEEEKYIRCLKRIMGLM